MHQPHWTEEKKTASEPQRGVIVCLKLYVTFSRAAFYCVWCERLLKSLIFWCGWTWNEVIFLSYKSFHGHRKSAQRSDWRCGKSVNINILQNCDARSEKENKILKQHGETSRLWRISVMRFKYSHTLKWLTVSVNVKNNHNLLVIMNVFDWNQD